MRFLYATIALFLFWSCGNHSESKIEESDNISSLDSINFNDFIIPGDTIAIFYLNAKISKDPVLNIEPGSNIVFRYEFTDDVLVNSNDMNNGFNIQFELTPKLNTDYYELSHLKSSNTSFVNWSSWGITDSIDQFNNSGIIKLNRLDSIKWTAEIEITNNSQDISEKFSATFLEYIPESEVVDDKIINQRDQFGRKQGYWEESYSWVTEKKGTYENNYFTGTEIAYKLRDSLGNIITDMSEKEISVIWKYENGKIISETKK